MGAQASLLLSFLKSLEAHSAGTVHPDMPEHGKLLASFLEMDDKISIKVRDAVFQHFVRGQNTENVDFKSWIDSLLSQHVTKLCNSHISILDTRHSGHAGWVFFLHGAGAHRCSLYLLL